MRVESALLAALLATASCGGGSDAMQKELSGIREELVKIRAQNIILTERLNSLEASRTAPVARPAPPPDDPDRPSLEVVRLSPDAPGKVQPGGAAEPAGSSTPPQSQNEGNAPADPLAGPRPVIRMTGKGPPSTVPAQKKHPLKPNARP